MKKSTAKGIPSSMEWNDVKAEGADSVCDLFADFFSSIYQEVDTLLQEDITFSLERLKNCNSNLEDLEITFDELLKRMLALDPSKGPGPDGISNFFLRECAVGLCEPLSFLLNKSLKLGIFPNCWKDAYVVPVFKAGRKI
ncbi:uncharacterized protein LOC125780017 [Bactrocera dorsalis]|uniref:Uncharacterized protein LOC125780017 n=1 Tax=Bactrocera dorsalis TaxID=27457 RepID=A0ABM3K7G0_BACDO|nr:uncharacterized protein LOC125780017 [Bactrocera dorsalis]